MSQGPTSRLALPRHGITAIERSKFAPNHRTPATAASSPPSPPSPPFRLRRLHRLFVSDMLITFCLLFAGYTPFLVAKTCMEQPRVCADYREKGEVAVGKATAAVAATTEPYIAKVDAFVSPYVEKTWKVVSPYVERASEACAKQLESAYNKVGGSPGWCSRSRPFIRPSVRPTDRRSTRPYNRATNQLTDRPPTARPKAYVLAVPKYVAAKEGYYTVSKAVKKRTPTKVVFHNKHQDLNTLNLSSSFL